MSRPARDVLDRARRSHLLARLQVAFICPTCTRAHEMKDLAAGDRQCQSCKRGRPSSDRPRCPDCTNVRPLPDDPLWFTTHFFKATA